jgi:hypothetical protein
MQANSATDPKLELPAGGDAKPSPSDAKPQNGRTPAKDDGGASNVPPVEVGLPGEANATSQLEPSKKTHKPPSVTGDAVMPPDATEGH